MQSGGARGLELRTAEVDHLIIEGMENLEVKQGILGNFIFWWKFFQYSLMNRVQKNSIYLKQKNFGNIINDFTLTFKKVFIYFTKALTDPKPLNGTV